MFRTLFGAAAALALAASAAADPITIPADPLAAFSEMPDDYRNWASVLSQVLLKKEGTEEGAAAALGRVMLAAHGHLAKVANGEELFPRMHLADPVFAADVDALPAALEEVVGKITGKVKVKLGGDVTKKVTKFAASKTFFNFAPCVLQETHTGLGARLAGLNFAPELFGFRPTLGRASFSGLQIAPRLIFLNPMGLQVQPQGLNVQPVLLFVGPVGLNVQPQGLNVQPAKIVVAPTKTNVQPSAKLVAPAKLVYAPVQILYNPQKGPVYAPVGDDLTTLDDNTNVAGGGGDAQIGGSGL